MEGDSYKPGAGSMEDKTVSFRIKVDANPGTSVRYAEVSIESPTNAFTPVRLNITQEGSTETFLVTPSNVAAISNVGDTIEFQVLSPRESWTAVAVSAGNWIKLNQTSGEASSEAVSVKAFISANEQNADRQAAIIFTREGGMGETVVIVNQNGDPSATGSEDPKYLPVVSNAWVLSGWTATHANVMAYYNSPSIEISKCGAYICQVRNGEDGETSTSYGYLHEDNSMEVPLDGLEPNTTYKVRCFVEYSLYGESRVATGGECIFTTPENNGQSDSDIK